MAVAQATLIQDVWQVIYDQVKTVTDPKARAGIGTDWIHSSFPDTKKWEQKYPGKDFFPQIIVESPSLQKQKLVFKRDNSLYLITIPLSVYDLRMDRTEKLCDDVRQKVETSQISIENNGLQLFQFSSTPIIVTFVDDNRIFEKRVEATFQVFV